MKRILFLLALCASLCVTAADAPPAQAPAAHNNVKLWQDARVGQPQFTTVRGVETGVLIQSNGETWRELRNGPVTLYGGILFCVVLGAIAVFYKLRGAIKLKAPMTGRLIPRFSYFERTVHWSMAGSFVILALSGLNMLFGKHLLLPLFGHSLFSWLAALCKNLHNFVGPLFLCSIVVAFFLFVKDNIWRASDWQWIRTAGGLISGGHVPSWRFNFGEKAWFWFGLVLIGLTISITANFDSYEIHKVGQALQIFCAEDLGGFYLDILKDRLYTTPANSPERRAAQSALWHILHAVTRLMAPILSFTAEEIWTLLGHDQSIMLTSWHELPAQDGEADLLERWRSIRELRGEVSKNMEALREAGKIGSSLQAEVEIRASGARYELLATLADDLRFVLICSKTTLVRAADVGAEAIIVSPSAHTKCPRCWHWREDVGRHEHAAEHPELCGRCSANLFGRGEPRAAA